MDAWMITSLVLGGVNLVANIGEGIACGMINSKAETAIADAVEARNMAGAARQIAYNATANNAQIAPTTQPAPVAQVAPAADPNMGGMIRNSANTVPVSEYEAMKNELADLKATLAHQQQAATNQAAIEAIAKSVAESMKGQFQGVIDSLNNSKK
jgi:hypothetical protein